MKKIIAKIISKSSYKKLLESADDRYENGKIIRDVREFKSLSNKGK